jgi:hypothetical protein
MTDPRSETPDLATLDDQLCFAIYSANTAINRMYRPYLSKLGLTYMVPRRRLELPLPYGNWHLKPARLPIPPPGQVSEARVIRRLAGAVNKAGAGLVQHRGGPLQRMDRRCVFWSTDANASPSCVRFLHDPSR